MGEPRAGVVRGFAHALHFAANDVGMVFFFALAAKEVFESTLPGGALGLGRSAALPVLAASGGIQAKMGALLSFAAGLAAAGLAVVLRVGRFARAGNRVRSHAIDRASAFRTLPASTRGSTSSRSA